MYRAYWVYRVSGLGFIEEKGVYRVYKVIKVSGLGFIDL